MTTSESKTETLQQLFNDWILEVKKDLHKRGNFWTPTLITRPAQARTVVLRSLEESADAESLLPAFIIHTDIRSKKWLELANDPDCGLHFYCSKRKWQMRIEGVTRLHTRDVFAEAQWQKLSSRSKRIYALKHQPGQLVNEPKQAYCFAAEETAFENFGVLCFQARKLESLQLERPDRTDYHVRAVWNLDSDELSYLAP